MKNQKFTLVLRLLFSFCLMVGVAAGVVAQSSTCVQPNTLNDNPDPWSPSCYLNAQCMVQGMPCQANDVVISNIGVEYSCTSGSSTTVQVSITFQNNTGASRYAVRAYLEFWENGIYKTFYTGCVADEIESGESIVIVLPIQEGCGNVLAVRNVWVSWSPNDELCDDATTCGDYPNSHCFDQLQSQLLLTPSYTWACQPNSYQVCFNGFAVGGNDPYTYRWLDGAGNELSFEEDPCITFNGPGPHTIKFEVTDSVFSEVTIIKNNIICAVILPIELTSFTAKEENHHVNLAWSTASEQGNEYFSVERSGPEYKFNEIAKIPGAGNSTEANQYEHVDKNPIEGLSYYRLKQVDYDGTFTYSPAVQVRVGNASKIKLYPSPASDLVNVSLSEPSEETMDWKMYDVSGRLVLSGTQESEVQQFPIALGSIPGGVYTLQVFAGREMFAERFIRK